MRIVTFAIIAILLNTGCSTKQAELTNEALMDSVQYRTFKYFWDAAEPSSGMARERYHIDDPENDKQIVTSGGSGFGIMALIVGMERGFITRKEGVERFEKIINFIENAETFHGAFPHWWNGETGKVKSFSRKDNGGDLVETAFLIQGLLAAHQYFINGNNSEKNLAQRIDKIWKNVEWTWYQNEQNVLFWHWSPNYQWEMNFPIRGYNECLITYILAASSPTYGVQAEVYHQGWAENGAIKNPHETSGYKLNLRYQVKYSPLFWTHYSFLGLNPTGLEDSYTNYFEEMKNQTLINRDYCVKNPKEYKGYGENCWGLTASYSVNGYHAHAPNENDDKGVISPTAALSSIVYTSEQSLQVMRHLYNMGEKVWGPYGFYDAFSETDEWFPQRYLAIDQGPIVVMIENYRTQLLWNLFMSHPDIKKGLSLLDFSF